MRVSREVAEKNREEVVKQAGQLFRENGYDGIGIAGLMKAAGMTHGGFYKQFANKEALAVEATEAVLAENRDAWADVLKRAEGDPLEALAQWYLSEPHLHARAKGCGMAALASEAPRHGTGLQQAFAAGLEASLALFGGADEDATLRRLSTMVGALILARATEGHPIAGRILDSARRS